MSDAVAFFSIRLVFGIAVSLLALIQEDFAGRDRRNSVVSAYFRIQMLVILGLGVLFGLMTAGQKLGAGVLCITAFVGSVLWLLEQRRAGSGAIGVILLAAGYLLIRSGPDVSGVWAWSSAFSSSLMLGGMLSAMLLGHRYLTAPGMSLEPLKRLNNWVGGCTLIRITISAILLFMNWSVILSQPTYVIWLALRWLAGILGPILVWYMVRRILIHKNTQSATGVLFVGVILTFIGELTADVLYRTVGSAF